MNTFKTTFLMALLTVLLVTAGGFLGGEGGMMMAFLFALVMNGVSYWFSDKIVLRMYGGEGDRSTRGAKALSDCARISVTRTNAHAQTLSDPPRDPECFCHW